MRHRAFKSLKLIQKTISLFILSLEAESQRIIKLEIKYDDRALFRIVEMLVKLF